MISLTCTGCRAVLQIDDAFVGGVCRCQHCGAIQTVPSDLRKGSTEKKVRTQKTLYRKSVRDEGVPSSGLDQLAQAVSSSGLSPGRLQELGGERRPKSRRGLLIGSAAAAGLIGVIVGVWIMLPARSNSVSSGTVSAAPVTPLIESPAPAPVAPTFLDVPIASQVVIYLLDRGSGTDALFSHLKEAALKSAATLGSGRKFQIIFWELDGSVDASPLTSPTIAGSRNVAAARDELDRIHPFGQTNIGPALKKAVAGSPQVIMLATGKGAQLDDAFAEQVMEILKDRPIKVYTFDLGAAEINRALETIAKRTGGQYRMVSEADLRRLTHD